jgi:hypothetical protein
MLTEYEAAAKSSGLDNDVTLAVGYAISQFWSVWKGAEVSDKATDALYQQMRGILESPEMAKISDADKQRFYERTLFTVFVFQISHQAAKDDAAKEKLGVGARSTLQSMLGADPDKLRLTDQGLEGIVAASPPRGVGSVLTGKVAAHTPPPGFAKVVGADGTVEYNADMTDGDQHNACLIRLLPQRPAPNGAAKAFPQVWRETLKGFVTPDKVDAASRITSYRRVFYPSKAVCHYMGGFFYAKDESVIKDQVYVAVYVFDLGKTVQPVIATATPTTGRYYALYESFVMRALAKGLGPLLDSLKFPDAPPVPAALFTRADAIGDWSESESFVATFSQYVTRTGAFAGIPATSYGAAYRYRPDGHFHYNFVWASSNSGVNQFGQDKNEGTFTIKNDIIRHTAKDPRHPMSGRKIAGSGFVQTEKGITRTLILRDSDSAGKFEAPPWMPNGRQWVGSASWLFENTKDKK